MGAGNLPDEHGKGDGSAGPGLGDFRSRPACLGPCRAHDARRPPPLSFSLSLSLFLTVSLSLFLGPSQSLCPPVSLVRVLSLSFSLAISFSLPHSLEREKETDVPKLDSETSDLVQLVWGPVAPTMPGASLFFSLSFSLFLSLSLAHTHTGVYFQ